MHYVNDSANPGYLRECRADEADCDGDWQILEIKYDDEGYATCVCQNFTTRTTTAG